MRRCPDRNTCLLCDRVIEPFTGNNCLESYKALWIGTNPERERKPPENPLTERLELYERNEIILPNINFWKRRRWQTAAIVSNKICITPSSLKYIYFFHLYYCQISLVLCLTLLAYANTVMASRFIFSEKAESGKKMDEVNQSVLYGIFIVFHILRFAVVFFSSEQSGFELYGVCVCGVIWCGAFYCKEASCKFGKVPTVNDSNERTAGPPLPSAFE